MSDEYPLVFKLQTEADNMVGHERWHQWLMELRILELNGRNVRSVNAQCVTKLSMAAINFVNIRMLQGTS